MNNGSKRIYGNGLTPQQERFCQLYATQRGFFGNGVRSYVEAYNIHATRPGAYRGARVSASRLLTNANILARLNELLDTGPLAPEAADMELFFIVMQRNDLRAKLAGIHEYNILRGRITKHRKHSIEKQQIKIVMQDYHPVGTTN